MKRIFLITLLVAPWALGQKTDDWNTVRRTVRAEMKARAEVRGIDLRLGDIADVSGVDDAVVRSARQLELGAAPTPGRARLLSRPTLRSLIDRAAKGRFDIRLEGATSVQVLPDVVSLSSDEVGTLARRWLWDALDWRGDGSQVRLANRPARLDTTAGRYSTRFEVVPVDPDAKLAGLVKLDVRAFVDGKFATSAPVHLVVRRPRPVLVLTRHVAAGRPVTADDVRREDRMDDGTTPNTLESTDALVGMIARRSLALGTVLSRGDLKGRPIVFHGDAVTVRVKSGALAVTGTGQAQGSGGVGEVIPVRTGDRRRIVHARIIDSETVEVDLRTPAKRGND